MNSIEYSKLGDIQKLELATKCVLGMDKTVRPLASNKKPGGLIEFSPKDQREAVVVGDLHANVRNLQSILRSSENFSKLREDKVVIILLGDIIHDERSGYSTAMDTSLAILDIVFHLIVRYPRNIVYLLGNHDTFSPQLAKQGIQQGVEFHKAVIRERGNKYAEAMQRFFDSLPLFVMHRHFLAVHAGPPRGGITREEIINIAQFPNLHWQLIWNRLNETRSNPNMKEYGPEDLEETRRLLHCAADIPVVVGHNPMWKWGGDDSVWPNPMGTRNHVILYSDLPKKCPYLSFQGSSRYEVLYADLRLRERRFVLDDYA